MAAIIDPTISTYLGLLSNILIFIVLFSKRINFSADTHNTIVKGTFLILLVVIVFGFVNQLIYNHTVNSNANISELISENEIFGDSIILLNQRINDLNTRLNRPYQAIGQFSEEGLAVIKKINRWGFLTKDGFEKFLNMDFQQVTKFNEGLAGVMLSNGKWGFINTRGIFPEGLEARFDKVNRFENGQAIVQIENRRMVVDRRGRVVREIEYRD